MLVESWSGSKRKSSVSSSYAEERKVRQKSGYDQETPVVMRLNYSQIRRRAIHETARQILENVRKHLQGKGAYTMILCTVPRRFIHEFDERFRAGAPQRLDNKYIFQAPQLIFKDEIAQEFRSQILAQRNGFCCCDVTIALDIGKLAPDVAWYKKRPSAAERSNEAKQPVPNIWIEVARKCGDDQEIAEEKFEKLKKHTRLRATHFVLIVLPKAIKNTAYQRNSLMPQHETGVREAKRLSEKPRRPPFIGHSAPPDHDWLYYKVQKRTTLALSDDLVLDLDAFASILNPQ